MYTGNRCGGGLNFYPNVYTLVREEVSASAGTTHIHIHTYYMHTDTWKRGWAAHRRTRVRSRMDSSTSLSLSSYSEREYEGADSLGGQFKNQYWPRSSQSFIYRRGLLAAREKRAKKIAPLSTLPFLPLPPSATSLRFPLPCCSKRVLNNAVILVTVPL